MGLVLVGTVASSYRVLETLIELKAPVQAVLSLSPVDALGVSDYVDLRPLADQNRIPHHYVKNINAPSILSYLSGLNPDVILVIGWSQLVRREFLGIPRFGCIGAHPALLPRNRGRAVIPWVLINDEPITGMTLFHIDEGTDSGPVIAQEVLSITDEDTAQSLYERAVDALCSMIRVHISNILAGTAPRMVQNEDYASYCAKRTPADGLIDWTASTRSIFNLVRSVSRPYPGAFTFDGNRRVIIWAARPEDEKWSGVPGQILRLHATCGALIKTGTGAIWITEAECEGVARTPATLFRRVGERLGAPTAVVLLDRILQLESKVKELEGNMAK